jgi:hypothetical protein
MPGRLQCIAFVNGALAIAIRLHKKALLGIALLFDA